MNIDKILTAAMEEMMPFESIPFYCLPALIIIIAMGIIVCIIACVKYYNEDKHMLDDGWLKPGWIPIFIVFALICIGYYGINALDTDLRNDYREKILFEDPDSLAILKNLKDSLTEANKQIIVYNKGRQFPFMNVLKREQYMKVIEIIKDFEEENKKAAEK